MMDRTCKTPLRHTMLQRSKLNYSINDLSLQHLRLNRKQVYGAASSMQLNGHSTNSKLNNLRMCVVIGI